MLIEIHNYNSLNLGCSIYGFSLIQQYTTMFKVSVRWIVGNQINSRVVAQLLRLVLFGLFFCQYPSEITRLHLWDDLDLHSPISPFQI